MQHTHTYIRLNGEGDDISIVDELACMASIFACNELCAAAQPDIAKAGETLITFSKQLPKYNISIHMRLAHLPIAIKVEP